MTFPPPTQADVAAAARRIEGLVWHTPLLYSAWLSKKTGADVWLKLELAQTTGSFKIRGACNALAVLTEEREAPSDVVTASTGNHGLALSWAAKRLGFRTRVYVPKTAPAEKRDALRDLGADVVETAGYEDAEVEARAYAATSGITYVSAYNHPDVIAGAGTVALEMFEDELALNVLIAPVGGGGLISGMAAFARSRPAHVEVVGAEAAASPAFSSALKAGQIVTVDVSPTLADGLAGNMEEGSRTFDLVRDLVDRVVVVDETSIAHALRELIAHERLLAEGAGAIGVASLLSGNIDVRGKRVGVVLTGRNVDADVVRRVLSSRA